MRASELFMPTLKQDPSDAEAVSHKLLVRGGFVRQFAAGIYLFLPLGWRVMERINRIIREEMVAIGAQELSMPTLHTADVWRQSGRYDDIGDEMFRLSDRGDRDMVLAMTHEEVFAWLAARELRSYKELPQIWYQIQLKFRDEPRPKGGVLRVREFLMKDSYSFDVDEAGLEQSYGRHISAYDRIFERCGVDYHRVESDPGMMGGAQAHEYMAAAAAGEDRVALCDACGYAANVELARSIPAPAQGEVGDDLTQVDTPGRRTIEEVSEFLGLPASSFVKALVYVKDGGGSGAGDGSPGDGVVMALVRGDDELHESKLARAVGAPVRPAHPEEVREAVGVEVGFVGPLGLEGREVRVVADESLAPNGPSGERGYVTGANVGGAHLVGVVFGRDVQPEYADLRVAREGDRCPTCPSAVRIEQVIEVGNIFKLGTKYSKPLGATVLDEDGKERPIVMGSYGIGPARIAAAAVEQRHDERGIVWPKTIAPFDVHLVQVQARDEAQRLVAQELYEELSAAGWQVLWDDRNERPGVKFSDAELIGCPVRVTVGRGAAERKVEVEPRSSEGREEVPVDSVAECVRALWESAT